MSRGRQRTWFDSAGAALDPGLRSQNLDETKHVRFRLAVSVNRGGSPRALRAPNPRSSTRALTTRSASPDPCQSQRPFGVFEVTQRPALGGDLFEQGCHAAHHPAFPLVAVGVQFLPLRRACRMPRRLRSPALPKIAHLWRLCKGR
jgi:hypothetical protein